MQRTRRSINALAPAVYAIAAIVIIGIVQGARAVNTSIPSTLPCSLAAIAIFFLSFLKSAYSRLIMAFWIAWFVIGSFSFTVNSAAHYGLLAKTSPNPNQFAVIYLSFIMAAIAGVIFNETFLRTHGSLNREPPRVYSLPSGVSILALMFFPIAYTISIAVSLKGLPILSGNNIIDSMYQLNAGPLQGYGIIIVISIALALYISRIDLASKRQSWKYAWIAIPVFLFCAISDGRRVLALLGFSVLGLSWYANAREGSKTTSLRVIAAGSAAFFLYSVAQIVRTGGVSRITDIGSAIASFGVEYWNSIYCVEFYPRETVIGAGYNWPMSTLASMTNQFVLTIFGVDKDTWVMRDSARTFMHMFNSTLGIRLGVPTELWYAFGWIGALLMFCLGFLLSRIADFTTRQTRLLPKLAALALLANLMLAVMGQSTVVFGALPTILYGLVALSAIDLLSSSRVSSFKFNQVLAAPFRSRAKSDVNGLTSQIGNANGTDPKRPAIPL